MAHMKILTIATAALLAGISAPASAQQPAAAQVVGKELPTQAKAGEVGRACGVVHQEGRTGCTHLGFRSRRILLGWIGSDPGEEGRLTEEERRELDSMLASGRPIHDRRSSTFIKIVPATAEEIAEAGKAGLTCPGMEPVINNPTAREAAHLFGRTKKKGVCHWAYGSSKGSH